MVERLIAAEGPVATQLWMSMRALPWFDRLDAEGAIARWLASEDDAIWARTMNVLLGAIKERPDRIAELIAPYAGNTPQYLNWLAWIIRFAHVHESRPLFDLMLGAVRRGEYNDREGALWMAAHVGQHQPTWAVELLAAWLVDRPGALDLDSRGRVGALQSREHNLVELARNGADRAPTEYCQALISYLLRVMSLTEGDTTKRPVTDRQFSFRQQNRGPMSDLGDVLLHGAARAVHELVERDHAAVQPILEVLAADSHDSAQWLLYEALRSAGERYADWAAVLLLQGEHRFHSGYLSDPLWTTRQLVEATTPHMSEEHLRKLEAALMALRPAWESREGAGWASFELLSGMAEVRLSDAAKRRLGELRRRCNREQPAGPSGATGGFVGPPIPQGAAQRMNDDQWLGAMKKHRTDRTNYAKLTGGVHELSQVLRAEATKDPTRFAKLALRLTQDIPPPYGNAILEALGQTDVPVEPAVVFDAVRHIAAFSNGESDQSLSLALHKQLDSAVPDDIIEVALDRALHSADPTEDAWSKQVHGGEYYYGGDIYTNGINCARGQAAVTLGDLIVYDTDGHRTQLVAPSLHRLAEDPSVAVRSCVAHLLAASLRHATTEALDAYEPLLATDDRLLATHPVVQLATYIGMGRPAVIEPVIERMLASEDASVRQSGGLLAAYAGLEFGLPDLLRAARESDDAATREGAAGLCARSLPHTSDVPAATAALIQFVADEDENVRKAAAQVTAALRSRELQPFNGVLRTLIASESFTEALAQLLFTLQDAPDRIDDIVITCTRRYIDVYGEEAGDMSTSAASQAQVISELTLRAYAQSSERELRRQVLDLIDDLLLINALGALEAVEQAER